MLLRRIMLTAWLMLGLSWSLMAQQPFADLHGGTGGLWLPVKLADWNAQDMRDMGLDLPVEDVYNPDRAALTDAIVVLDGGSCTAEAVSPEGLLLTNHHCTYDHVAELATPEDDILTNGFWAASRAEERPIPGATAGFLIRSEDVTDQLVDETGSPLPNQSSLISAIQAKAVEGTHYEAKVKPVLSGNEFYLFVYETFRDVRLVGVPPSAIGKYGGDTDNWMWPRHTGDFAMIRVYVGADGKPADYAPDNIPYRPQTFLPISLAGTEVGDYTMVIGYPGATERYLSSHAIEQKLTIHNPDYINVMSGVAKLMRTAVRQDDTVRLALAGSYAGLMNGYKYFLGQTEMLDRYDIVGQKREAEAAFQAWVEEDPERTAKWQTLLKDLSTALDASVPYERYYNYLILSVAHPDVAAQGVHFSYSKLRRLQADARSGREDLLAQTRRQLSTAIPAHFEGFIPEVDQEMFVQQFLAFYQNLSSDLHPAIFEEVASGVMGGEVVEAPVVPDPEPEKPKRKRRNKKKKRGERAEAESGEAAPVEGAMPLPASSLEDRVRKWAAAAYAQSLAASPERLAQFLDAPDRAQIEEDPLLRYANQILQFYGGNIAMLMSMQEQEVESLRRTYLAALQEMYPDKHFYPDANSTMRVSYGTVQPYSPQDGVLYEHYTTLAGVMEKEDPSNSDFIVPARLKELYEAKDYGRYGEDGVMPTCFLSTCESSGGGSGSPTVNGKGELIGIIFDGNWEAMTIDIYPIPSLTRSIIVDIRYVLFIIDKFAGATHLIDEMTIRE